MPKKAQADHHRSIKKGNTSTNPDRIAKGGNMRTQSTIKRLNMYRSKTIRNRKGEFVGGAFMSRDLPSQPYVEPNRKWFGNTRVVDQKKLESFREELQKTEGNPYQFVMKRGRVPYGLLQDSKHTAHVNLLSMESFDDTFGPKKRRKKPTIAAADYDALVEKANEKNDGYKEDKDRNILVEEEFRENKTEQQIFERGQSKRIWGELYKVIDSSDVIIQVLDARDPMGTRSKHIEEHLKKDRRHKQLIFVLNKCDLIPTWATARWVKVLSQDFPTLAFHASITNPYGKGALIQLLRQFGKLHSDKKQISVGFIGYPNVGKSSIINTLRSKKVCNVAPIPGETKVWQYITLFKRIFLIDCPGVVYPTGDSEAEIVLKGVIRIENLSFPEDFIEPILSRVKPEYITATYGVESWTDTMDFLGQYAKNTGKLLKGAEPDTATVAKMILHDWQRGKIPYFICPPFDDAEDEKKEKEKEPQADPESFEGKREMGTILKDIPQNFKKISVKQQFTDADTAIPEALQGIELNQQRGTDWDEVLGDVAGEDAKDPMDMDDDSDQDDALFDQMVSNTSEKMNENIELDVEKELNDEFASDSDEDSMPIQKKPKFVVLNKTPKRRNRGKKKKGNTPDDGFDIVKAPRVTTNKKKVGVHFYDNLRSNKRNKRKQ
uniref:Nucleolar GTP-binding protein 2 n=1 Tax=Vannella robusta TaxID=1487602 RepID=A0A7S4MAL0_9EUKA